MGNGGVYMLGEQQGQEAPFKDRRAAARSGGTAGALAAPFGIPFSSAINNRLPRRSPIHWAREFAHDRRRGRLRARCHRNPLKELAERNGYAGFALPRGGRVDPVEIWR